MYDIRKLRSDPEAVALTAEKSPRRGKSYCLWKFNAPLADLKRGASVGDSVLTLIHAILTLF